MLRRRHWLKQWLILGLLMAVMQGTLSAQWLHYPTPGIPRTRDGKPNLTAPAPKGGDGKPDLSGLWLPQNDPHTIGTDGELLPARFIDLTKGLKPEDVSMEPWAQALFQERLRNFQKDDPTSHCQPVGMPRADIVPSTIKILQTPGLTVMLLESDTTFRQIYTDGRKLPEDSQPSWMGYSTGRWEENDFVVETIGFHDKGWLDAEGHPHSDALRLTERFRRTDFGRMELQMTIDDPKTYKKPFTVSQILELVPDSDLLEYFCSENERDAQHFVTR
jgi:hypothetical protein